MRERHGKNPLILRDCDERGSKERATLVIELGLIFLREHLLKTGAASFKVCDVAKGEGGHRIVNQLAQAVVPHHKVCTQGFVAPHEILKSEREAQNVQIAFHRQADPLVELTPSVI